MKKSAKKLIVNVIISLCSFLVILLVFEIFLRLIYGNHLTYEIDNDIYWRLKPGQVGYPILGLPKAKINNQGFRGDEIANKTFNMFMLGDSYTFGWGVENNETFSYLLDNKLSEINENIQVINMGSPGWGLFQENMILKKYYEFYKPKILILTLPKQDLARLKFQDMGEEKKFLIRAKIRVFFMRFSFLSFLKQRASPIFDTTFGGSDDHVKTVDKTNIWEKNKADLDSIYDFTEKHNMTFILLLYPNIWEGNSEFYEWFNNYAKGRKIILINDLDSKFNSFKIEDLIVDKDSHPSPLAHKIVSDRLLYEIKDKEILI